MQVFAYKMCNFLKKVFQCPRKTQAFLFFCKKKVKLFAHVKNYY